jgi:sulfur carrier protein
MMVSLNGDSVEPRGATNVAELIDRYAIPPQTVLVEHNGLALHRAEWAARELAEGDTIELLRVVAGG